MTSITLFNGAESLGKNKIYVEKGRLSFLLDFGKFGAFFFKFLNERPGRGLNDSFFFDFVQKLNSYRKVLGTTDLPFTRFPVWIRFSSRSIGLLNENIPVDS